MIKLIIFNNINKYKTRKKNKNKNKLTKNKKVLIFNKNNNSNNNLPFNKDSILFLINMLTTMIWKVRTVLKRNIAIKENPCQ